jgi:RNA polymerase II subunit A small phosphatase-like protein
MLLILDIDGTLIYPEDYKLDDYDFSFYVYNSTIYVKKRPWLDEFLKLCFKHFQVAIWSASGKEYVDRVLENILASDQKPVFVWSADRCTQVRSRDGLSSYPTYVVKDLKKVWRRKLYHRNQTLIVDDTSSTYSRNYGNAVPIKSYMGAKDDQELGRVWKLLFELKDCSNVRCIEKRVIQR